VAKSAHAASASAARFSSFECGEAESCNIRHPFHKILKQFEQTMAPFSRYDEYSTDSAWNLN
jgi:cytochrome c peroxidase